MSTIDAQVQPPKFTVDPSLLMDDIIEKLQLLNYQQRFCVTRGHKPLSRFYFAVDEDSSEPRATKVAYLVELCYWLMSLGFEDILR